MVHVHGNSATMAIEAIAMKICKVPLRITHSHNTVTAHPLMHALLKPILNFCVNAPVACGHDAGAYIYSKEFKVIPNCINVSEFKFDIDKREGYRKKLNVKDEFLIGNVGRFTFQKNHEFMIEGFAKIKKKIPDSNKIKESFLDSTSIGQKEIEICNYYWGNNIKRTELELKSIAEMSVELTRNKHGYSYKSLSDYQKLLDKYKAEDEIKYKLLKQAIKS